MPVVRLRIAISTHEASTESISTSNGMRRVSRCGRMQAVANAIATASHASALSLRPPRCTSDSVIG
jgi:hypothetical protein